MYHLLTSMQVQWMHETPLLSAVFNGISFANCWVIFFRSLHCEFPWWVSMVEPIQNDNTTCLTHYLDFNHSIFICSTGLLKVGKSRNSSSTVVIKAEWDSFVEELQLSGFIEPINQTSVCSKRHYFVHFGNNTH
jgi:hypothetical protein